MPRRILPFFAALLMLMALAGCTETPPAATPHPEDTPVFTPGPDDDEIGYYGETPAPITQPGPDAAATLPAPQTSADDTDFSKDLAALTGDESPHEAMALLLSGDGEIPDADIEAFLNYHSALCYDITLDESRLEAAVDMALEDQQANFYAVREIEGMPEIYTDITAVYLALDGRLSANADAWFSLQADYAQDLLVSDGALHQSWDYLAEYMMRHFDYLQSYPDGFMVASAQEQFAWAYSIYIGALQLPNTPSITGDSLIYQLRESYADFLVSYGDSPLAEGISLLLEKWRTHNYEVNDEALTTITQLDDQLGYASLDFEYDDSSDD